MLKKKSKENFRLNLLCLIGKKYSQHLRCFDSNVFYFLFFGNILDNLNT